MAEGGQREPKGQGQGLFRLSEVGGVLESSVGGDDGEKQQSKEKSKQGLCFRRRLLRHASGSQTAATCRTLFLTSTLDVLSLCTSTIFSRDTASPGDLVDSSLAPTRHSPTPPPMTSPSPCPQGQPIPCDSCGSFPRTCSCSSPDQPSPSPGCHHQSSPSLSKPKPSTFTDIRNECVFHSFRSS